MNLPAIAMAQYQFPGVAADPNRQRENTGIITKLMFWGHHPRHHLQKNRSNTKAESANTQKIASGLSDHYPAYKKGRWYV